MIDFSEFKNKDGVTYNGAALLAKLSGLTEAEVVAEFEKAKKAALTKKTQEQPR